MDDKTAITAVVEAIKAVNRKTGFKRSTSQKKADEIRLAVMRKKYGKP